MARKRKNVKDVIENMILSDCGDGDTFVGTPTMVLLPARNYYFRVLNSKFSITIPREGTYFDLDSDFYTKEEGSFSILDEEKMVLYMPSISKVLFGVHKYPDLAPNQLFAPAALVFNKDTVEIIGQLIEVLDPSNQ